MPNRAPTARPRAWYFRPRGPGAAARASPYLTHEPLQTLQPSPTYPYPFTPSPTTPSSSSDTPLHRFTTKSAPASSSSRSPSETETTDTSQAAEERATRSGSGALIPILAKFDIDRRKAGWYEPWLRSHRLNHQKQRASTGARTAPPARAARTRTGSAARLRRWRSASTTGT
ncbi:hypothetical protein B0H17DRAFT_44353 [Mycena rosella]|uniref:Uncharacterized protein n=1 Tax=Mycena rosella TaxID=1033263 RepID=A0AAD7GAC9_MYCRO|nr:hypothetical protein B0H17DRAFT_44353 [Mycena rosella]